MLRRLYPFESHYLDLDGARYHYVDEGAGDPILFVHGNPTWSFHFRDLVRGLSDSHRSIAPDHIGCGMSDKPQHYDYCLRRHIDNLEQLVLRLDLNRITLVVHDWGGPIGLGVALRHMRRFQRFVLFNTAAFRSRQMPWQLRLARTPMLGEFLIRRMNLFVRTAIHLAPIEKLSPEVKAGYLLPYDSVENRIAIDRFVRDIPMQPGDRSFELLTQIENGSSALNTRPTLIIWGARDFVFTDRFLERWREILPAATVWKIEHAGHYVVEDARDIILPRLKAFLSPVESPRSP